MAGMNIDIGGIYSGTFLPQGSSVDPFTPQAVVAGTSYSTPAVLHTQGFTPGGGQQNVQPGIGEPQSVVLLVETAPGDTSSGASYTVSLLTDTNPNLTTTPVTLATLVIPNATVAGTYFLLDLPNTLTFELYSGLKFVLVNGSGTATIGIVAWLQPRYSLQRDVYYQSGWVIENQ